MVEYLIKFQMILNQKLIDNKIFRVDKKKYEKIKYHTKKQLKGINQKQNAKYSSK